MGGFGDMNILFLLLLGLCTCISLCLGTSPPAFLCDELLLILQVSA